MTFEGKVIWKLTPFYLSKMGQEFEARQQKLYILNAINEQRGIRRISQGADNQAAVGDSRWQCAAMNQMERGSIEVEMATDEGP